MISKYASMCLALTALTLCGNGVADDPRRNQPQLVWSEEFEVGTSPDTKIWNFETGGSGWGNQELQTYTGLPSNVRVENGNLVISARRTGNDQLPFTSARINTLGKLEFQYGILVARIKLPELGDGLWPAFWAMGKNFPEVGWPDCGELDVMELGHGDAIRDGVVNRRVGSAAHWEYKNKHAQYSQSLDAPSDLNDGFHIFRMTWTPEFVRTSIDGEPIWTMDIRKRVCSDCSEFHQPYFIILNLAVGGVYPGMMSPDEITAPFPAEMWVDYIRIYHNGFTQLGGSALNRADSNQDPVNSKP